MIVILSSQVKKRLKKLSRIDLAIVGKKLKKLENKSSTLDEKKIRGSKNLFRVRVGSYRIVYRKTKNKIYVTMIGHRKEVYRLLKNYKIKF